MKLPLLSAVAGLLVGIAAVLWIAPQTPGGAAVIIFVAMLATTLVGLVGGKVAALLVRRRAP